MPYRFLLLLIALFSTTFSFSKEKTIIRVGHFPNLTHAQALIAHQLSRLGRGWFEERLGPDVELQWFVYNAGPSAMEAILTDSIQMTYVGPSPAINAFLRSKGEEVRIVAGACSGGSALVVRDGSQIADDPDFKGKRIGTPQFGNTQDIAARAWLKSIGLNVTLTGGDAYVIPTSPADQLFLFKTGELDASWTIEPWVSRLILQEDARLYFNESILWPETNGKYVTTHLVSSRKFINDHPDIVQKWVRAHVELTDWINKNPETAKALLTAELKQETRFDLPKNILDRAWQNIELTSDPVQQSLYKYADAAFQIGFFKKKPELEGIYDLRFLKEVLGNGPAK